MLVYDSEYVANALGARHAAVYNKELVAMKGHGVAGALASCRHTLRSAGVARGSLHMAREASADASLGADKAAILFAIRRARFVRG